MAEDSVEPERTQGSNITLSPRDPSAVRESKATVWSAVFAGFSLVALLASIYISFNATKLTEQQTKLSGQQTELTEQQNTDAREQELVTLVTDIEQNQQGSGTINGQSISAELTQLGEAEEASTLINGLPPSDVSSVERYIVGIGLEDGDDYQPALTLVMKAAQEASDPRTASDAWRAAAQINYELGFAPQAESDISLAKQAFDGPGVRKFNKESNQAFTDLFDIPYRAPFDCSFAVSEWNEAARLYKENHNFLTGPNAIADEKNAASSLANHPATCHVSAAVLKKIPIQGGLTQTGSAG